MRHFSTTAVGAICASLFCATASYAEVTAAQVWESWKEMSASWGQTITGTESVSGDTLTVSGVVVSMTHPEGTMRGELETVALRENGDGTVTVTMAPEYLLSFTSSDAAEEDVDMTLRLTQSGLEIRVDGNENAMSYDLGAAGITLEMVEMTVDGAPLDMNMAMTLSAPAGTYLISQGGSGPMAAEGTADAMRLVMSGTDPEGGATFDVTYDLSEISANTLTQMVAGVDTSDLNAMLQAGFAADGKFGFGSSSFSIAGVDEGQQFTASGGSQGGSASFAMSKESLNYAASQRGFEIALSGSDIPFPQITAQLGELGFSVTMPVSKSDAPQDFALLTSIRGLTVGNEIWSMFDPAGMIPREPANLVVDLAGTGKWLVDIMDPAVAGNLDGQPGELHSLSLKDIELTFAGASLTGTGEFTFDNSDLESFDGMPAPSGQAAFTLSGANKLLDTLVNMGLVPQDQAQGLRMMTGMFARAGEGEDTLVSEIVITDDGQVLANGQRLK
ncbi:DUF2125 domain-containing protein [Actibacterium sp. MT2.3-13A]|uniref:DUF2125 domain-containing protein n=1 Tax=Actibacterium sp. MT2.3-13A TaxID=2828332 RepID=UPI001BA4567B|nr:DUF2125 domain-containing protein [Actibacterium sp. MT2.3-13A]